MKHDKMVSKAPSSIVLATTSKYRLALFDRLQLAYQAVDPELDEAPYKALGLVPEKLVAVLAEAKCRAVEAVQPDALIIGSDQCAEIDGEVLGKPGSAQGAAEQLERLAGRTHRLLTGVCVLNSCNGSAEVHVDVHRLTVRNLSRAQIARYVARDNPIDCAGAYKLEAHGITLFERIEGADYTAIIGLPLMMLTRLLTDQGVELP